MKTKKLKSAAALLAATAALLACGLFLASIHQDKASAAEYVEQAAEQARPVGAESVASLAGRAENGYCAVQAKGKGGSHSSGSHGSSKGSSSSSSSGSSSGSGGGASSESASGGSPSGSSSSSSSSSAGSSSSSSGSTSYGSSGFSRFYSSLPFFRHMHLLGSGDGSGISLEQILIIAFAAIIIACIFIFVKFRN